MKTKLVICIILSALIAVSTISGCEKAPEAELAATFDEVPITESVVNTPVQTTVIAVSTTISTTETTVGESSTAPTEPTKTEESTKATDITQTSNNDSNADKTENKAPVNTQKPNNTTNNNNVSGNTTNKPNNNTSNNKPSNTEKPKPKPVETKPPVTEPPATEPPVITDDTPLTFEKMNTAENMQKIVDYCNAYFETLGMYYNDELDPSWAGWYYGRQGGLCVFDTCSLNEEKQLVAGTIKTQVDAILISYDGYSYTDIGYKVMYVVNELDGYYDIVFCYG